ncbi:hypothetical protein [Bacillus velezensis]|uniref:hypothetical protein n=1 Tax=Bacillus velezensis TaxID=492670 RepID=UPI001CF9CEFE|nr:hypothetical protein [Bacillus velezensis]GJI62598.1 hypothetical protein BVSY1_17540 [Bacillus velezensis]
MTLKYTMSEAETVEAMVQWLKQRGYVAAKGRFVLNQWNREVKAEFTLRKQ